jgi:hypothetical protein
MIRQFGCLPLPLQVMTRKFPQRQAHDVLGVIKGWSYFPYQFKNGGMRLIRQV